MRTVGKMLSVKSKALVEEMLEVELDFQKQVGKDWGSLTCFASNDGVEGRDYFGGGGFGCEGWYGVICDELITKYMVL